MKALLSGICFLLLTCSFLQANDAGALFASVNARLSLMKPVAAWKLDKGVAVEDLAREKVVLDKAVASAEQLGINAASTRAFFQAQIEAAKEIQRCWIKRWQSGAAPKMTEYPDLKDEIRPDLIRLGREILVRFKATLVGHVHRRPIPFELLHRSRQDRPRGHKTAPRLQTGRWIGDRG